MNRMDEVAKRIWLQRNNYIKQNGLKYPNAVFLGFETLDGLKAETRFLNEQDFGHNGESPVIFGMEIIPVGKVKFLAVGHIEKEVEPDGNEALRN